MTEPERPGAVVGASEGDQVLSSLGVRRLAIPVPFPQAGGPVNAYLIDERDGSLALWDAGLGSDEARAALEQGFREAGRRIEEVRRVFVSHGHVDHYGAAAFVARRSGAQVFAHPADFQKMLPPPDRAGREQAMGAYLARLGLPAEVIRAVGESHAATLRFAERLERLSPLAEGDRLEFARFEGRVLHMPGHTPGLVVLHVPAERLVFTDDHLLARVSPNPLLELGAKGEEDKFRALESYLASARRLRGLDVGWVCPGHGPPFQGHRQVVDSLLGFYQKRQGRIRDALSNGPRTAYELVQEVFGQGNALQLFLMVSEIVGNLEVLEAAGAVRRVEGEIPYRFELARPPGA